MIVKVDSSGNTTRAPVSFVHPDNDGFISGQISVGSKLIGSDTLVFMDEQTGRTAYVPVTVKAPEQPSTYTATFQEYGISSGVTWSVNVGGTDHSGSGSSISVPSLTGAVDR